MSEIRITGEIRTDYDCETTGLPAERWVEAGFGIKDGEIVLEVSMEENVIVANNGRRKNGAEGNLEGFEKALKRRNKGKIINFIIILKVMQKVLLPTA